MTPKEVQDMLVRLAWIGGMLILAGVIISAAMHKRSKDARDVLLQIEPLASGHSLVSKQDILLSIERSFGHTMAGIPLQELDVERVERVLEADPFILNADVYIDAENQVHIHLQQREPVLRIIDQNGLTYYLDELGKKMPLSEHFTARVLVATGKIPPHVPDFQNRKRHVLKDLFALSKRIRSDAFLQPMIEQIDIDKTKDFTLVPKLGKQKIILGDLTQLEDKIDRLKTFYNEGLSRTGWDRYRLINLKYNGQVVCTKRAI